MIKELLGLLDPTFTIYLASRDLMRARRADGTMSTHCCSCWFEDAGTHGLHIAQIAFRHPLQCCGHLPQRVIVRRRPAFGAALLEEAAQCMLNGELAVARNLIRDVIKGSIGYSELSRRTGTPEKSLVRMFGPSGNPTAANLSRIFAHLQRHEGVTLQVRSSPAPGKTPAKRATSSRRAA